MLNYLQEIGLYLPRNNMYTEKKFANNYALAGSKALLYNVHHDNIFNTNGKIKDEYVNDIIDIGFEWKQSTIQTWTRVSLKKTTKTYISSIDELKNYNDEIAEQYMCERYTSSETRGVYPTRVLIKNLMQGMTYSVRSYYISSEQTEPVYYNEQTIQLFNSVSTIAFSEPNFTTSAKNTDNISEEELQSFTDTVVQCCSEVAEIYKMFAPGYTTQVGLTIDYDSKGNWAASAGSGHVTYNSAYRNESSNGVRSVLIHEMAHNFMLNEKNAPNPTYKDKIIKFMEFATNAPHAMWKWQASHNYPVISSARYTYMDDCLVVAACQLSQEMHNS